MTAANWRQTGSSAIKRRKEGPDAGVTRTTGQGLLLVAPRGRTQLKSIVKASKLALPASVKPAVLAHGEILEDYPNDPRGPSALVLGYAENGRPLHAVCAFDPSGILLIITVYEPEPPKWENARTRRQQ
ncbi:DUF4258 domain-containing protein [Moorella naiadis]|uniref:DUF4258 domain-containing protein n=1 Tax=Moorella naiadis (nom. illeg.) TaxID=3093670 RepID=UPI003D9C7CBA